jgi:hypothetical protein
MRGHVLHVCATTCFLLAAAASASADVCVTIDAAHDTLSAQDQTAALLLVSRQFEQEGERVVAPGCPASYLLSHIRLGNVIVVSLSGPGGQREAQALGMDDLPALYSQMVRSVLTGRPMTGLNVVDRTNVTAAQATGRRVYSDSLWYGRLGYGSIFGDQVYATPSFGFGFRGELDSLGIDVSFLNFQMGGWDDYGSGSAAASSILKLSGLYFLKPRANHTPYLGAGLSYGNRSFSSGWSSTPGPYRSSWDGDGLQGELSVGYELARATSLRMFVQADTVLPFYHVSSETYSRFGMVTSTDRRYAPSLVVSIGVGR